jgi:hypothetical protein
MTTFFVSGEVPDNILRSLTATISIAQYEIIRPGAEFINKYDAKWTQLTSAINEAEITYGRNSDELHAARMEFAKWHKGFVAGEYPGRSEIHVVNAAPGQKTTEQEKAESLIVRNIDSAYRKNIVCEWRYNPPGYMPSHPATVTGVTHEGRVRTEFKLEFTWFVRAEKTIVTMLPYIKPSMSPVKIKESVTEEWHYDVPVSADQQITLNRLIAERNEMDRENGYGSDIDTGPIQHDIYLLCATLG